jgi:hypothetical protein
VIGSLSVTRCFSVGFLAQAPTHPIGQELSLRSLKTA